MSAPDRGEVPGAGRAVRHDDGAHEERAVPRGRPGPADVRSALRHVTGCY